MGWDLTIQIVIIIFFVYVAAVGIIQNWKK